MKCPHCSGSEIHLAGFSRTVSCISARRRRYYCRRCRCRFSENALSLCYRLKKRDLALNGKIFHLCLQGISNRRVGRILQVSDHCVRLRLFRMAQVAFRFQLDVLKDFKIKEPICFDGLENFAGSQYDVNNIQQAAGRDSLFIYDFNLATMNRKGYMSEWQKRRLFEIESNEGRYNPRAIRLATQDILRRLYEKWGLTSPFVLLSDEHFQYRRVVKQDLRQFKIEHTTVSSKACRNFQNILFPVNHLDLRIRQHLAAFTRETISFSKSHAAMCQKYALFMVRKNFMEPQFTKVHVRRPRAHLESPAQALGLTTRILDFTDIFHDRRFAAQHHFKNEDWKYFIEGQIPPQYHRDTRFLRKFAAA